MRGAPRVDYVATIHSPNVISCASNDPANFVGAFPSRRKLVTFDLLGILEDFSNHFLPSLKGTKSKALIKVPRYPLLIYNHSKSSSISKFINCIQPQSQLL